MREEKKAWISSEASWLMKSLKRDQDLLHPLNVMMRSHDLCHVGNTSPKMMENNTEKADIAFTLIRCFLPASYASTLVSDSSAAFAELIPPPYPGITFAAAMYERDTIEPPGFIIGAKWLTMDTKE